jgi:GT2 family glycosyltransferase
MIELSIILVNWNCIAFTEQCLRSIQTAALEFNYQVIVVDNDSADAPCSDLVRQFPWIELVLSRQNIGFGGANNLGVKHTSAAYLLFLNPDTIVKGDALERMLAAIKSMPRIGALGCKLLNPDGTLQTTCVLGFPTVLNQLLAVGWLQEAWPTLSLWRKRAIYSEPSSKLHEVDAVSGAAIFVRRTAFEEVGGFNPEYFMYAEEVELCHSIHRAGWKVVHLNNAEIIHFGGQSTKNREDNFTAVTMRDSIYRFLYRTRGSRDAALYRVGLFASAALRMPIIACLLLFNIMSNRRSQKADRLRVFHKWVAIAQWSLHGDTRGLHPSRSSSDESAAMSK